MTTFRIKTFLTITIFSAIYYQATAQDSELTNYHSGISLHFGDSESLATDKGVGYMEEYLFSDKFVSDRKIVYIRSDTKISASHNKFNNIASYPNKGYYYIIGENGPDGFPNSGDEGTIRLKIDRDRQIGAFKWAASESDPTNLFPAYEGPFSFDELTYESGVAVVGTTGPNGSPENDRVQFYHRGIVGPFGDEWHTIHVADDDRSIIPDKKKEYWSSDGKEFIFVVNPKTPGLTIRASGDSQFYTTPPKTYFTPKIHSQTTYFNARDGEISVEIRDIFERDVYFRIVEDVNDDFTAFTNPEKDYAYIRSDIIPSGESFLQYYSKGLSEYTKTRKLVKNPQHPSLIENHGLLLFENEETKQKAIQRMSREPYKSGYSRAKRYNDQDKWDLHGQTGQRRIYFNPEPSWRSSHPAKQDTSLNNAWVALVEGWLATGKGKAKTFGEYAKEMLLGNQFFRVDPIGWEIRHVQHPHPSTEVIGAGYYVAKAIFTATPSYDIIAAHFRDDQVRGGLTAIEDYYIRDQLARYPYLSLLGHSIEDKSGMWNTARDVASLMVAICLKEYSTPWYGTSGYGSVKTTYYMAPYPDQALTWKELLSDRNTQPLGFPNLNYNFDPEIDDLWLENGQWGGPNLGYSNLMKSTYEILLNLATLHDKQNTYPEVRLGMEKGIKGELIGTKGAGPIYQSHPRLANDRFPLLSELSRTAIKSIPDTEKGNEKNEMFSGDVLNLIWYDDKIEGIEGSIPIKPSNLSTK